MTLETRFWSKVKKGSGCWEWTGHRNSKGYGIIRRGSVKDGASYAHRVSYEINNGTIPSDQVVRHRCDNPGCVRPDHLILGTQLQNIDDMVSRDRHTAGERHPQHRLSPDQVKAIRSRFAEGGILQQDLAQEFGIVQSHLSAILRGEYWKQDEIAQRPTITDVQAAAHYGVNTVTIRRWIKAARLPGIRRGRFYFVYEPLPEAIVLRRQGQPDMFDQEVQS